MIYILKKHKKAMSDKIINKEENKKVENQQKKQKSIKVLENDFNKLLSDVEEINILLKLNNIKTINELQQYIDKIKKHKCGGNNYQIVGENDNIDFIEMYNSANKELKEYKDKFESLTKITTSFLITFGFSSFDDATEKLNKIYINKTEILDPKNKKN